MPMRELLTSTLRLRGTVQPFILLQKCPQRTENFFRFVLGFFSPALAHSPFSMPAAMSSVCIWACNLVRFGTSKFYGAPMVLAAAALLSG